MKKIAVFLAVAVLSLMIFVWSPTPSQAQKSRILKNPNKIANQYIVVLDDAVVGEKGAFSIAPYIASEMAATYKGKINYVYQDALNGFAVEMTEKEAETLSLDYRVKFVEEDGVVTADATQTNATWGLDRIDQRNLHSAIPITTTGPGRA